MKAVRLPLPTRYAEAMKQLRGYMLKYRIEDIEVEGDCTACEAVFRMAPREEAPDPNAATRMLIERLESRCQELDAACEQAQLDIKQAQMEAQRYKHRYLDVKRAWADDLGNKKARIRKKTEKKFDPEKPDDRMKRKHEHLKAVLGPERAAISIEIRRLMAERGINMVVLAKMTERSRNTVYGLIGQPNYSTDGLRSLLEDFKAVLAGIPMPSQEGKGPVDIPMDKEEAVDARLDKLEASLRRRKRPVDEKKIRMIIRTKRILLMNDISIKALADRLGKRPRNVYSILNNGTSSLDTYEEMLKQAGALAGEGEEEARPAKAG